MKISFHQPLDSDYTKLFGEINGLIINLIGLIKFSKKTWKKTSEDFI